MIYQCIINISEGRDNNVINSVADASEGICLDIHSDPDHHRSVLTLASNSLDETLSSAKAVSRAAIEQIEFESHEGVHPRVGAVDVVPFVSYDESGIKPNQETILAAKNFGTWINSEFDIEVYFYDMASNNETTLPEIRTNRDLSIAPDIPSALYYNRHGSVCVGAREPLLAINVNLDCNDLELAKTIAMQIRESSGGIKGVRAIGLELTKQK